MKNFAFIALIIFVFTFSAFGQKGAAGKAAAADPSKAVGETFDRLIDGIKQVDVDKVMSVYDKTDRLLLQRLGHDRLGKYAVEPRIAVFKDKGRHAGGDGAADRNALENKRLCYLQVETIAGIQREAGKLDRPDDAGF
jgi:hypothetical protein